MQGRRSMVTMAALAAAAMWLGSSRPAYAATMFNCSAHPNRHYVDDCTAGGVTQGDFCVRPELGCCAPGTCKNNGMGTLFCDPSNTEIDCSENPDNICTTDTCSPQHTPAYPDANYYQALCTHTNNTSACSDRNKCTGTGTAGTDQCLNGACAPGANNSNTCNDGNACTHDDQCSGGACAGTNDANGTNCSDGSGCTDPDSCQNGVCVGTPICNTIQYNTECSTGMACVGNSCKPTPRVDSNGTNCDDGLECTSSSQCFDGECGGPGHRTAGNVGAPCWDHNYCKTAGTCTGGINCPDGPRTPLALHAACDDHNSCTQNTTCECPPGNPPPCSGNAEVCTVPATNGCNTSGSCVNCGIPCSAGAVLGFPCGCTDINQAVPN